MFDLHLGNFDLTNSKWDLNLKLRFNRGRNHSKGNISFQKVYIRKIKFSWDGYSQQKNWWNAICGV